MSERRELPLLYIIIMHFMDAHPDIKIAGCRTVNQDRLGVWSRNEVVRIDFEDCGNFRPGLADDLIGRSPFQGLQVLGEVVGGDEGQKQGPSGCADRRSGRP